MLKLDERKIIGIFQKSFVVNSHQNEDVEIFKLNRDYGIIKTDTLVESTDVPPQMKPFQISRKSVVGPISDFAAKGVKPLYGIVSVSLPKHYSRSNIIDLARGFRQAAKEFDIKILGGDTNEAKEIVISVTLFGISKKIIPRNGAREGDIIITTGPFGNAAAGLKILLHKNKSNGKFKKYAEDAVLLPKPRLRFGILAAKYLNSSMDSSDGLSTTLSEMAKSSKKKFIITHIPKDEELDEFANSYSNMLDLVFHGGEEYEIVGTVSQKNIQKLKKIAENNKIDLIEIGYVKNGCGVFLQNDKKDTRIVNRGWSHFTVRRDFI